MQDGLGLGAHDRLGLAAHDGLRLGAHNGLGLRVCDHAWQTTPLLFLRWP